MTLDLLLQLSQIIQTCWREWIEFLKLRHFKKFPFSFLDYILFYLGKKSTILYNLLVRFTAVFLTIKNKFDFLKETFGPTWFYLFSFHFFVGWCRRCRRSSVIGVREWLLPKNINSNEKPKVHILKAHFCTKIKSLLTSFKWKRRQKYINFWIVLR